MRDHVIVYVLLLTLVCYLQQGMFTMMFIVDAPYDAFEDLCCSVVVYTEVGPKVGPNRCVPVVHGNSHSVLEPAEMHELYGVLLPGESGS